MKGFICALIVFILITGLVIFSTLYIADFCGDVKKAVSALPSHEETVSSDVLRDFDKIEEIFDKRKQIIKLLVGRIEFESVFNILREAEVRYENGDFIGYAAIRDRLLRVVSNDLN